MSEFSLDIASQIHTQRGGGGHTSRTVDNNNIVSGNDVNSNNNNNGDGDGGNDAAAAKAGSPGAAHDRYEITDIADISELDDFDVSALHDDGGGAASAARENSSRVPVYSHNFTSPVWSLAAMQHRHIIKDGKDGMQRTHATPFLALTRARDTLPRLPRRNSLLFSNVGVFIQS
jgi:hypothetical protein